MNLIACLRRCCALSVVLATAAALPAYAIEIVDGFSFARHDRFNPGDGSEPFIGADLDLSGVSRQSAWATLISDTHFITSDHAPPGIGSGKVKFFREDDVNSETWTGDVLNDYVQIGDADLRIGRLASAAPEWVRRYPLLKRPYSDPSVNYNVLALDEVDETVFLVGRNHSPNPGNPAQFQPTIRVGTNTIDSTGFLRPDNAGRATLTYTFTVDRDNPLPDEATVRGGDSSGPSFASLPVIGSALTGIHIQCFASADGGCSGTGGLDVDLTHYINDIRSIVEGRGESINVVTDLPGDANGDFVVDFQDVSALSSGIASGTGSTLIEGDFNLDKVVDFLDVSILSNSLGSSLSPIADRNGDFSVDGLDFEEVAENWQEAVIAGQDGDFNGDGMVDRHDVLLFEAFSLGNGPRPEPLADIPGDLNSDGVFDDLDVSIATNITNGDYDGDGDSDFIDISILSANFGRVFGDVTGDGYVDSGDVDALNQFWMQSVTGGHTQGDLNADGFVDATDLAAIGYWWRPNRATSTTSGNSVPEPATTSLLTFAVALSVVRRRA